jgi:hypothetical protein
MINLSYRFLVMLWPSAHKSCPHLQVGKQVTTALCRNLAINAVRILTAAARMRAER